jgi:hypothetical protein
MQFGWRSKHNILWRNLMESDDLEHKVNLETGQRKVDGCTVDLLKLVQDGMHSMSFIQNCWILRIQHQRILYVPYVIDFKSALLI